ncbi:MAG: c-type cytochrome [Chitinophagaceae bacterium]
MKKVILSFAIGILLISCGNNSDDKKTTEETTETKTDAPTTSDLSSNPDYQTGLGLVAKSDCLTCHKVDETLTGPPYRDVANKYASMSDTIVTHLAGKIIKGGSGVWGEIAMTPHPTVSQGDAEAMVKYILLLKK